MMLVCRESKTIHFADQMIIIEAPCEMIPLPEIERSLL